jgi:hypothetical protein
LTDVLWWTREKEIFKEIGAIMGLDHVDRFTHGWFPHRNTASKNILDNMTDSEKTAIRKKAEDFAANGLPESIKRK